VKLGYGVKRYHRGLERQHEGTTLFPEDTELRKSGKAQSNEMVIAREKQGREHGNSPQRTEEMLWWESDRSSASTSWNKALI